MLLKSLALNFQLAQGWFALTILLAIPSALISSPDSLFRYITIFVMLIGVQKITGEGYFGDEGSFFQTLPISQKYMIAGKALSSGVIMGSTICLISVVSSASILPEEEGPSLQLPNYLEKMSTWFLFQGMSPWQTGMAMALIPIVLILLGSIFCILMIRIQRLIYASKQKKHARAFSMTVMAFLLGIVKMQLLYISGKYGLIVGNTEMAFIVFIGTILVLVGILALLVQLPLAVSKKP